MVMVCQVASMVTHDHVSRYHVPAPMVLPGEYLQASVKLKPSDQGYPSCRSLHASKEKGALNQV